MIETIKKISGKTWLFLKKPRGIITAVLVIILIIIFYPRTGPAPEIITVKKGIITQTVIVTGTTKPVNDLSLSFERGGRLSYLPVAVGQKIRAGQLLAQLSADDLSAQYQQAQAQLKIAQATRNQYQAALEAQKAKLADVQAGARAEDIAAKNNELALAQQNLDSAYQNTINIINGGFVSVDDALRKQISDLFLNADSQNPKLSFLSTDSQAQTDVEFQRLVAANEMKTWQDEKNTLNATSTPGNFDWALSQGQIHTSIILKFLDRLMDATTAGAGLPASTLSTYKTSVTTARINVNTVATNFASQLASLKSQKISIEKIQNELALKLAGATDQAIEQQKQAVKQAEANLAGQDAQIQNAQAGVAAAGAQIGKATINATIDGTIVKILPNVGEMVNAGQMVLSLVSLNQLEIETNIPETDIGKVALDNPVSITLDALQGKAFTGKVSYIEPSETIVDGVVNYKVRINFDKEDPRFKSGLTANLSIETLRKDNVLIASRDAFLDNGAGVVAKKIDHGKTTQVKVELGIRGENNLVEILSGLAENDQVINVGLKVTP